MAFLERCQAVQLFPNHPASVVSAADG
jgi:hypothetical protein